MAERVWSVQRERVLADEGKDYIRNQGEHHKRRSFEEEFVALLKKSGV